MSMSSDLPSVYLEFPNFGYGPASAILALVEPIIDEYSWHIVSTGGAADFARRHVPSAIVHEIDSFHATSWPYFFQVASPGSVVISATNPHFAGWAAQHGYKVGIVDTLDWMWEASPPGVEKVEFHLVQRYFGSREGKQQYKGRRQAIRPIVDTSLWTSRETARHPGTAVVGFGGMSVPDRGKGTAGYVTWLLSAALPLLVEHAGCSRVAIVGARRDMVELVPKPWTSHPVVDIRAGMDRTKYAALLRGSEHLVLAPGLASIHECAAAGLAPLSQPGFNMSMVLQASDLMATGYPHVASWPWLEDAVVNLGGMAELDGLNYLADLIDDTVRTSNPDKCGITKAMLSYLDCDPTVKLDLPDTKHLPDGRDLLVEHLLALT